MGKTHNIKTTSGIVVIIGAVLSGFASGAFPQVWSWFKATFSMFGATLSWIWTGLISSYSVPGWILILMTITAVPTLIFLVNKAIKRPAYYSYTSDHISGANWEWEWSLGAIENLKCYCVYCKAELIDEQYDAYESTTHYFCENCKERRFSVHGGRSSYVHGMVKREIDRRIRMNLMKLNKA